MSNSIRSLRAFLPIVACALSVTAIAVPCRASAQIVASPGASPMAAGPRLPVERTARRVTLRGERADAATRVAHRDTTFRISLLAVVVGVLLLVILL